LREFGLKGETNPHTGVWIGDNKICAMGIRSSKIKNIRTVEILPKISKETLFGELFKA